jgi:hypothetical protein
LTAIYQHQRGGKESNANEQRIGLINQVLVLTALENNADVSNNIFLNFVTQGEIIVST